MVLCGHKLIPPAMKALLEEGEVKIDGFLCPGHVSTIIGSRAYEFLARNYGIPCVVTGFEPLDILQGINLDYGIPCVVTGFEPLDILQGINLLISQIHQSEAKVENEYTLPPRSF